MDIHGKLTYNISSLHDKLCFSIGYQLLKHIGEVLGDLFERKLDGFMLALLQYIHQLHDGVVITLELFFSFSEFLFPLREADELLQSLFVDMAVLLELSVGLLKFLPKLRVEIKKSKNEFTHAHRFNNIRSLKLGDGLERVTYSQLIG
jgi:hypothetical protein